MEKVPGKSVLRIPMPRRREVIAGGSLLALGWLARGFFDTKEHKSEVVMQKEEEQPMPFPDGTTYLPIGTRDTFKRFGSTRNLFRGRIEQSDMHTLPQLNLTSSGVTAELKRLENAGGVHRITLLDIQNNTAAYRELSPVLAVGENWRCRGVGIKANVPAVTAEEKKKEEEKTEAQKKKEEIQRKKDKEKNKPEYLRLRPHARNLLALAASGFQDALKAVGLSEEWHVRLIVNGLLRSDGKGGTNDIKGASDISPHLFGAGIDLSLSRFDIINAATKEFFTTNANEDEDLSRTLRGILGGVLKKMHDDKKFVLTYEPKTDHFHISAVTPQK